jgi:hypothetical protein
VTRRKRGEPPICWSCKEPLQGARLVIDGRWLCSDCVYEAEYGPTERVAPPPRRNAVHPQEEHLFPLPPTGGRAR